MNVLTLRHNMRLGQVARIGFGSIMLVMLGIGASYRLTLNKLDETTSWVIHTYEVQSDLRLLKRQLVDAETGQRGFALTEQENFLDPYNQTLASFDQTISELKTLMDDNPEQVARINEVEELADLKFAEMAETIRLIQADQREAMLALILSGEGKQIMDDIRLLLDEMEATEMNLLASRIADAEQAKQRSNWITLGSIVLMVGLCAATLYVISRQVIRPIHQVADGLSQSSVDMQNTIIEQEAIARQQAAAVQQTNATMSELGASSQQSAEQAERSAQSAKQVMGMAQDSKQAVGLALNDMASVQEGVEAVTARIHQLDAQAQQIAQIIDVVTDLANQTNMLALNAAVEAVRSETNSRGFGVVAGEIRKLADQSKASAHKIGQLIHEVQESLAATVTTANTSQTIVERGATNINATAETFLAVADSMNQVVSSNEQISLNAQQQAIAIQQVIDAMESLNHEAMRSATGLQQTRVSADDMTIAVKQLQSVV